MKFCICAVRDRAVDGYGTPIFVVNSAVAIRSFSDEISKKDSPWFAHPEDYELFYLGEYDDSNGSFTSPGLFSLAHGKDFHHG